MQFILKFADCCDQMWEDAKKPPRDRKVHHILLLGQGGSGKTHVVQSLVFKAVAFIWPAATPPRAEVDGSGGVQRPG